MSNDLENLKGHILAALDSSLNGAHITNGELVLEARREDIAGTIAFLRDDPVCKFTTLIDICGVDYPGRERRFDVVYHLLSMQLNHRIRVKITTDADTPVRTMTGVYPAANWFEREAFDMYGIAFDEHPDLRRLLTDYGFEGHPLRKDFPLSGFVEVRYDEERKSVIYEAVNLPQEFRDFDFMSPWEGAKYVMDEEEKGEGV
ncbi:MAG: NADH-quinone oxidoreductase subunit C [Robiginitomaculum sp.]|nr:MAG: NADH-quinone oxidoreductase subunit C [Robiginitomaculum sp.]